jgi:hypothetical protein
MVRDGMLRPVVIPKKKDLKEDIVLGICRTLGKTKKELMAVLNQTTRKESAKEKTQKESAKDKIQ